MAPNWFIALPVPASPWFDHRFDPPSPAFRRCHPQDLHLTVAFLGAVTETQARAAFDRPLAWDQGAIAVGLGPIVPLGNPHRYSALSILLTLGHDRACSLLHQNQPHLLGTAGVPLDPRPPKPHITVMRPQRHASHQDRQIGLTWAEGWDLSQTDPLLLRDIALYTWTDDRQTHLFEIVDRRPL